jgi:hypothetical protein
MNTLGRFADRWDELDTHAKLFALTAYAAVWLMLWFSNQ